MFVRWQGQSGQGVVSRSYLPTEWVSQKNFKLADQVLYGKKLISCKIHVKGGVTSRSPPIVKALLLATRVNIFRKSICAKFDEIGSFSNVIRSFANLLVIFG